MRVRQGGREGGFITNSSLKWWFACRVSTLSRSPTKFTVRSSLFINSQPADKEDETQLCYIRLTGEVYASIMDT